MPDLSITGKQLWQQWAAMWNGNLNVVEDIIPASGFEAHLTDIGVLFADPDAIRIDSAAQVRHWVQSIRGRYQSLIYTTVAGPYIDVASGVIIAAWQAEGVFSGKSSRPDDVAGASFTMVGMDMLKAQDGKLVEYWAINATGPWHHAHG